ncbi:hypothetical protein G3I23_07215 [Streptomyces sp. SID10115]|uniref:hypothetical protein n=1 Tax=unclassified Streptomyces TaxID=2593676 RepID=UPI0013C79BE4|nr:MULTISPECIES: hypothetical protein [unclassified Streptomyces]NDZ85354.1 hypothetical protein [Streptomyces sp. SID10115]
MVFRGYVLGLVSWVTLPPDSAAVAGSIDRHPNTYVEGINYRLTDPLVVVHDR